MTVVQFKDVIKNDVCAKGTKESIQIDGFFVSSTKKTSRSECRVFVPLANDPKIIARSALFFIASPRTVFFILFIFSILSLYE